MMETQTKDEIFFWRKECHLKIDKEPTKEELTFMRKEQWLALRKEERRMREGRRNTSPYIKKDRQISKEMRLAAIARKRDRFFFGKTPESVRKIHRPPARGASPLEKKV